MRACGRNITAVLNPVSALLDGQSELSDLHDRRDLVDDISAKLHLNSDWIPFLDLDGDLQLR